MDDSVSSRERRRSEARWLRRTARARTIGRARRRQSGQSLIIFALSLTVLLGLAGLSVDVMRLYDIYARAERAAEAGALAGVMYMPCYWNSKTSSCGDGTTSPDNESATQRAMQEVYRNGFGTLPATDTQANPCPTPATNVEVAVCQVSGKATDLQVTITESINIFLLSVTGVTTTTISASAQAEYLPPIQIGSRYNYFGDQGECVAGGVYSDCSPNNTSLTHVQNFLASMNGPMELKEQGDPYVYCEEGQSQLNANGSSPDGVSHTYNGYTTNHPQYGNAPHCGTVGNPDQQESGYAGPMTAGTGHPGAYNYYLVVPPGGSNETVWIYMPNFIPTDFSTTSTVDQFLGPYNQYPYNLGAGYYTYNGRFDNSTYFFNMTYTLYNAPVTYLRSQDSQVAGQQNSTFAPYDMMQNDLSAHGCSTSGAWVYDTTSNTCKQWSTIMSAQNCVSHWCPISPPTGLAPGSYRLAVEATGINSNIAGLAASLFGWGSKSYAVKMCTSTFATPIGCTAPSGTVLAAWNDMDVIFQAPASQTNAYFDLACIPSQYAGRTISVGLYDPGDSAGGGSNIYVRLVPPAGSGINVTYLAGVRTGTDAAGKTAIFASQGGDRIYNGLWVNTPVALPSSYSGTCDSAAGTGWWQIYYSTTGGAPHDKVAVSFSLVGSPVHLVTLG